MADFFDINPVADQSLLHSSIRDDAELQNVVDQVEWEIIDYFRQRENQSLATYADFFEYESGASLDRDIKVRLVGYDQATPTDSRDDLQEALRRTIADITTWVLRNYSNPQGVQSKSLSKRSYTATGVIPTWREWPDGWKSKLRNFDAKIPSYGI